MIQEIKISDFAEVVPGGTPSTTNKEYWEGGNIPWLNSGELNKKYIYESKNFITELGLKKSSTRLMPPNTVLIALTGATCGLTALSKIEACANQSVTGILPSKSHVAEYLFHFLRTQRQIILDKAWGNAQPHISQAFVKDYKIPLPSIPDQQHIANLLSKAETLITQRKETLRLLDEYLKSTFLEMFGDPAINKMKWRILSIRELSLRFSDGPFGSNLKTEHYSDSGIQVIRLQNIGINEYFEKDICYVNLPHYESVLKKYSCIPGDIVIATMGVPNIRSCIVPKHLEVAVNKADCVQLRVNPKLANSFYISQLLNLEAFLFLAKSFIHGQTRARISSGQIAKIPVPVPPIELQTQFAQIVEKTEALKTKYQQSLQELENLYNTLSQKAFRGELSRKIQPTNHKTRKS